MNADLRASAESRLAEAASAARLKDPRPAYRERLRQLRETHPAAFAKAVAHYDEAVLPRLAAGAALSVWTEYGRFLGELTAEGQVTRIDATGRAEPWSASGDAGDVVLFIPSDTSDPLIIAEPVEPSAAQTATIDLLVNRRLALG